MKRVIFITLYYFTIIVKGYSQTYFSNRYAFYNKANLTENFILVNDTFYLATGVFDSAVPYTLYKGAVTKINLNGSIINVPKFNSSKGVYNLPNSLTTVNNKIYLIGTGGFANQEQYSLTKLNYNSDTIYNKILGDTSNYNYINRIIPYYKTKNKILLIGVTDSLCGPGHQGTYKPIIRVVDTNGVLFQTKLYLSNCKYRNITSVDTTENKGYLIGFAGSFTTWQTEARLLKLDSNLNVVWDKQINLVSGGACSVVNHKNTQYMVLSTHVDSVWNFNYMWERVSFTKLDLQGNVVWQKYYGVKERPMITSAIKECANGDYIMCGSHVTNQLMGWIMRTDSLGNLKWWKDYRPDTSPILDTLAQNYLYDIMELPNKDIAAVGWAGQSTISPLQQTWLLKVDSNGCFGSNNCPQNYITGIPATNSANVGFTVYPNPANDILNIKVGTIKENTKIKIADVIGRTILITEYKSQLDISFLEKGIYFVTIQQEGKTLGTKKIIKQ